MSFESSMKVTRSGKLFANAFYTLSFLDFENPKIFLIISATFYLFLI